MIAGELAGTDGRCNGRRRRLNEVYVGCGVFIRGARPDVATAYPTTLQNDRAGWGFMLLTNQSARRATARSRSSSAPATDRQRRAREFVPGNITELRPPHDHVNNATATIPFGTIDTPVQGERISGSELHQLRLGADAATQDDPQGRVDHLRARGRRHHWERLLQ